jgi:hypothetical protein
MRSFLPRQSTALQALESLIIFVATSRIAFILTRQRAKSILQCRIIARRGRAVLFNQFYRGGYLTVLLGKVVARFPIQQEVCFSQRNGFGLAVAS